MKTALIEETKAEKAKFKQLGTIRKRKYYIRKVEMQYKAQYALPKAKEGNETAKLKESRDRCTDAHSFSAVTSFNELVNNTSKLVCVVCGQSGHQMNYCDMHHELKARFSFNGVTADIYKRVISLIFQSK